MNDSIRKNLTEVLTDNGNVSKKIIMIKQQISAKASLFDKFFKIGKWLFLAFVGSGVLIISLLFLALYFGPAKEASPTSQVSNSIAELRNQIDIDVPIKSAQWQIFGSPEDTGAGAVAPTDDIILIAEIELADPNWSIANAKKNYLMRAVPEASRPWLSRPFRIEIERSRTTGSPRADVQCKDYVTNYKTSKKPVEGFICAIPNRVLLYLSLADSGT